jgi:hypothetical protein
MPLYKYTFDKKVDGEDDYSLTLESEDGSTYSLWVKNIGEISPDEFVFDVDMKRGSETSHLYANLTREAVTELRDYLSAQLNAKE